MFDQPSALLCDGIFKFGAAIEAMHTAAHRITGGEIRLGRRANVVARQLHLERRALQQRERLPRRKT
jgi:hypothetical protein